MDKSTYFKLSFVLSIIGLFICGYGIYNTYGEMNTSCFEFTLVSLCLAVMLYLSVNRFRKLAQPNR